MEEEKTVNIEQSDYGQGIGAAAGQLGGNEADSDGVDQSHLHVSVIRLPEETDPEDDNYGINDTQNYFLPNV